MKIAQIRNPVVELLNPGEKGRSDVELLSLLITRAIRALFIAATIFFIFYFIIGAIRWIMSSGDPKQIESARNQIIHALIGLVILFSLFAVLKVIEILFGVDILKINIEPLKITSP